jgi:hypothetical protein
MPRRVVVFDRFDAGEFGLLGEREAPRGSWTGKNVLRYIDGSIGPRSGLVDMATTSTPTGAVAGFGHNPSAGKVWFVIGRNVYQVTDAPGNAVVTVGTNVITATPTNRVRGIDTTYNTTAFAVLDDQGYYIDHAGAACTALTQMPGGRTAARLGDRYVTAGKSANPNRVYFSAPGLVDTWDPTDYFDVGGPSPITGLHGSGSRLVIVKAEGSWWVLTGVPGVNDVLREIVRGASPSPDAIAAVTRQAVAGDGKVWFLPYNGEYPTVFTGSPGMRHEDYLTLTKNGDTFPDSGTPKIGVTGLLMPDEMFFATGANSGSYDNQGLLLHNGVWSRHTFGKNISGWVEGLNDTYRRVFLTDGGAGGVAPKFYIWHYGNTRPPFAANAYEKNTDAGTAFTSEFTLPAWWHEVEGEFLVAGVTVEFRKWAHGYGGNNSFTVEVTPLHIDGGEGAVVNDTFTESAATPTGGVAGQDDAFTATFADDTASGEGVRVKITGIVGCAIQKVRVLLDERPQRSVDSSA